MPRSPRVSVIVPAHNYARFLSEALDSVRAQTFDDWECIVVDDGSTDDTATVARAYEADARFRYVHQDNRGPSAARNTGLQHARGELIQFLDADDRLMPRKLELHVRHLDDHPEHDIVYGEVAFFRSERPSVLMASLHGRLSHSIMGRVHGNAEAREKLEHYNIMSTLAALFRHRVFTVAGRFDEAVGGSEDWDLWIRCAAAGCSFDYLPSEPLAAVRAHPTSTSRDTTRMLRGVMRAAASFSASELAARWPGGRLPLIYEVVLGIADAESGRRRMGMNRILKAAAAATEPLTAWRWRVYAMAALLLPASLLLRLAAWPIPERPYAWYRRVRRLFKR